jgi:hypothetical protein
VKLNIDKDQETHKTMFGGLCSVAINLFMVTYLGYLLYLCAWYENSEEAVIYGRVDIDKEDPVSLDASKFISFYHITEGDEELDLKSESYKKYMDFKFI